MNIANAVPAWGLKAFQRTSNPLMKDQAVPGSLPYDSYTNETYTRVLDVAAFARYDESSLDEAIGMPGTVRVDGKTMVYEGDPSLTSKNKGGQFEAVTTFASSSSTESAFCWVHYKDNSESSSESSMGYRDFALNGVGLQVSGFEESAKPSTPDSAFCKVQVAKIFEWHRRDSDLAQEAYLLTK